MPIMKFEAITSKVQPGKRRGAGRGNNRGRNGGRGMRQ